MVRQSTRRVGCGDGSVIVLCVCVYVRARDLGGSHLEWQRCVWKVTNIDLFRTCFPICIGPMLVCTLSYLPLKRT